MIINNQLMSDTSKKYQDYDSYSELKKVSRYNTFLLAKLIQLVANEELDEESLFLKIWK